MSRSWLFNHESVWVRLSRCSCSVTADRRLPGRTGGWHSACAVVYRESASGLWGWGGGGGEVTQPPLRSPLDVPPHHAAPCRVLCCLHHSLPVGHHHKRAEPTLVLDHNYSRRRAGRCCRQTRLKPSHHHIYSRRRAAGRCCRQTRLKPSHHHIYSSRRAAGRCCRQTRLKPSHHHNYSRRRAAGRCCRQTRLKPSHHHIYSRRRAAALAAAADRPVYIL